MYSPEKKKACQKRWYEAHKNEPEFIAKRKESRHSTYIRHKDKELASSKAWKQSHPDKVAEINKKQREKAKLKALMGE